jgi:hypothetical protein
VANSAPERRFPVPRGRWGFVEYARTANGRYEAEEFLNKTILRDFGKTNGKTVQRRLIAIFQNISDFGVSPKLEHKQGEVWGIKFEFSRKLIRFACFQMGRCWVLTHGFYKPGAKKKLGPWPNAELDRADRIRLEHINYLASNQHG